MVILKQTTIFHHKKKGNFDHRWLIITHDTTGPSLFIYKNEQAKQLIEDEIKVGQLAESIRFGTTTRQIPASPVVKNDHRIHDSNFISISTEKLIKKNQKQPHIIWLAAQSTIELFQIIKLLSASLVAVGFQAPLPNQLDDEWALHRYGAKVFSPSNDWEKYWDNPPREIPAIPTNLVQIQQIGLAKSADQIPTTIKDKKKEKDDKKKKMYSSSPALVDEPFQEREVVEKQPSPPPPQPTPKQTKKSSNSSSSSSLSSSSSSSQSEEEPVPVPVPVASVKEKKKKQPKSKPRSHTIETDRASVKKGYPEPQASDSRFYEVLKPVKDVPQRPLPAPKTRKYEPRSQSVAPTEIYRPKKPPPPPRSDTTSETDSSGFSKVYKNPYDSAKKIPSSRSSPFIEKRIFEYEKASAPFCPPSPERESSPIYAYKRSESVHSIKSRGSKNSVKSYMIEIKQKELSPTPLKRAPPIQSLYDYPPDEHEIPITIMSPKPRSKKPDPGWVSSPTPTRASYPDREDYYSPPQIRKSSHPTPDFAKQRTEKPAKLAKPKPSKRANVGYLNAMVQTDHSIQNYPLIEVPTERPDSPHSDQSFEEKVERLRTLTTPRAAPNFDVDKLPPPRNGKTDDFSKFHHQSNSNLLKTFSRNDKSDTDSDSSSSSSTSSSSSSDSSSAKKKKKSKAKKKSKPKSPSSKKSSIGSYTLDKPLIMTKSVNKLDEPQLVVEDNESRVYSIETRF